MQWAPICANYVVAISARQLTWCFTHLNGLSFKTTFWNTWHALRGRARFPLLSFQITEPERALDQRLQWSFLRVYKCAFLWDFLKFISFSRKVIIPKSLRTAARDPSRDHACDCVLCDKTSVHLHTSPNSKKPCTWHIFINPRGKSVISLSEISVTGWTRWCNCGLRKVSLVPSEMACLSHCMICRYYILWFSRALVQGRPPKLPN